MLVATYALWQRKRWGGMSVGIECLSIGLGLLFLFGLIAVGLNRLTVNAEAREFLALKATVEAARENERISELELAALQHKIVEANEWLASTQYYRRLFWTDVFYPPIVLRLEPIR